MKKDLLKDILREKSHIQLPQDFDQDFYEKFDKHLASKKTKKRIFFGLKSFSLTLASLLVFAIAVINYSGPTSQQVPVSEYLSFIDSNFKNEDFIHDNIDEIDGLAYTNFYDDY